MVVEQFAVTEPRTKVLVQRLAELDLESVLIVTEELDQNLYLSSRNLHQVDVRDVAWSSLLEGGFTLPSVHKD